MLTEEELTQQDIVDNAINDMLETIMDSVGIRDKYLIITMSGTRGLIRDLVTEQLSSLFYISPRDIYPYID